jgi:hypothetical protein
VLVPCPLGEVGDAQAKGSAPVIQCLAEGQGLADGDPLGIVGLSLGSHRCCDDLLGAEYRTGYPRLLARAAPAPSGMLRKTAKPEAIAAAVCWVIGEGNQHFGQGTGELRVKDLMSYFSLERGGSPGSS